MSKLLLLAKKFNCFYLKGLATGECKPFIVEGIQVGLIRPDVLEQLLNFPEVFSVTSEYVELNPAFRNYEERTIKVDEVLRKLHSDQKFVTLKGWRNEAQLQVASPLRFDTASKFKTVLFEGKLVD